MAAQPPANRLERYLLPGERVVFAVRRHWASVALPVLAAVGAVVLAGIADARLPRGAGVLANIVVLAAVVVVGWAAFKVVEWRHDWLVATDKRLLLSTGLVTQSTPMMPLARVTDMNYQRTPMGRLLGYGTFVMESAGQVQALSELGWMPDPDHNYRVLVAEIFGVEGDDDDLHDRPVYADWDESPGDDGSSSGGPFGDQVGDDRSTAIRLRGNRSGDSVYRSPDLEAQDRSADTGPLRYYPPEDGR